MLAIKEKDVCFCGHRERCTNEFVPCVRPLKGERDKYGRDCIWQFEGGYGGDWCELEGMFLDPLGEDLDCYGMGRDEVIRDVGDWNKKTLIMEDKFRIVLDLLEPELEESEDVIMTE